MPIFSQNQTPAMGLLDQILAQGGYSSAPEGINPIGQGLLSAGAGILQGNDQGMGLGGALGLGIQQGLQGYNGGQERVRQQRSDALRTARETQAYQLDAIRMKRSQDEQEAAIKAATKLGLPPELALASPEGFAKVIGELYSPKKPLDRYDIKDGIVFDKYTGETKQLPPGLPGGQKPPAGYRTNADGSGLEPIPGGPAEKVSADEASKLAQIQTAQQLLPTVKDQLVNSTPSIFGQALEAGSTGRARRVVKQSIEAYLRATSGAAVPQQEVDRALELYMPSYTDSRKTREQKFSTLSKYLDQAASNMARGHFAPATQPTATPDATSQGGGWSIKRVK